MVQTGLAESLIENEIGCGCFQVLIVIFMYCMTRAAFLFTGLMMTYGIYNPGWRCMDMANTTTSIITATRNATSTSSTTTSMTTAILNANNTPYRTDLSCAAFEACSNVEFNPDSLTVVTEWGLLCNKAWIPSLIISLGLAGTLVGSSFAGQVADSIGRKKTLYGFLFIITGTVAASAFAPSWQVFAGFQFVNGILQGVFGSMRYVYPAEFIVKKWRGPLAGLPAWGISGIIFALVAMWLKNWRHLLIAASVVCFLTFLPAIYLPESLRWLEVKNKKEEFIRVAKKMARANGKKLKQLEGVDNTEQTLDLQQVDSKRHTIVDLFRPGYKLITILIAVSYSCNGFLFLSINLGVKALSGDFFVNLILIFGINIVCGMFAVFAPNLLGRRGGSIAFEMLAAVCLFTSTCFELWTSGNVKVFGTLVPILISQMAVDTVMCVQQVHLGELYPTVVRALAVSWVSVTSRLAALCVSFIIPKDADSVYQWYLIMAIVALVSTLSMIKIPETKGKPLKETFEKRGNNKVVDDDEEDGL